MKAPRKHGDHISQIELCHGSRRPVWGHLNIIHFAGKVLFIKSVIFKYYILYKIGKVTEISAIKAKFMHVGVYEFCHRQLKIFNYDSFFPRFKILFIKTRQSYPGYSN